MAFFSSGSRALVEILTRLQSAERPMPVDQTFFEFGSMKYHIQASPSDPENVHLSISTPSLSHEASPSTALPEFTLQETMKTYRDFAELKHILGNLGSSGTTRLVYNHRDPFFVSRTPGKLNAIFPMRFRDDTDLAVATSFFQELQDAGNSYSKAPKCSWSAIPPPELRGESVHHLTTNGGFVSFDILERHVKRRRAAKTAWILLNFQSYVKYHIKCTRSYIQSRMRKRQERLTEVIQDARLRGSDNTKKLQVRKKSKRRLISLGKAKKLQKGFRAVVDRMKRLRLWIRVRALDRLRRHYRQCFAVPRVKGNKYYDKLE
ncbi:hypothetical protein ACQ4PT_023856 [Festuca glaucescens]